MKALILLIPVVLLSFFAGVLSTKTIPMDGYPEKPSNTYLVVSNFAQMVVDAWRPKKHEDIVYGYTNVFLTNSGSTISLSTLTNGYTYSIVLTEWSSTNTSWVVTKSSH